MTTPFKRAAIPRVSVGSLALTDPDLGDGETGDNPTTATNPIPGAPITLDAPVLLAPTNGYLLPWWSSSITLKWSGEKNVTFRVQVSWSSSFDGVRTEEFSTTAVSYNFTPTRGQYWWRVKAHDEANGRFSPWSEVWSFGREEDINYDQQPGDGQSDDGSDAAPDAPLPPGPDDEIDPDPEDPGDGEGGVEGTVLNVGGFVTPTPPLPLGGSALLTAVIESTHPIVLYTWSLIVNNDGGVLVDTDKVQAGYIAPGFVTDDLVILTVTDSAGNLGVSEPISISVRDTETDDPADTTDDNEFVSTGCTTKLGDISPADLSALGWGVDSTSSNPADGNFPTGVERFSSSAKQYADFGAMVWSGDSGWFRYYVKGYKVKIFYPASNRSGILSLNVVRYNPHLQDTEDVGTIFFDQSAAVIDTDGDECWEMREIEVDLSQFSGGLDPEWIYYSGTKTIKRWIYRLDFSYQSVGSLSGTEYGSWFAALCGIQQFRQHRYQVLVDTEANWDTGIYYGAYRSGDVVYGRETDVGGTPQGASGAALTQSGLKTNADYDLMRSEAWIANNAFLWGVYGGVTAEWRGRSFQGPPYSGDILARAVRLDIVRSDLTVGTTAILRVAWSVGTENNPSDLPAAGTLLQLRRGSPAGQIGLPGIFVASANYWDHTVDGSGGYLDFSVSANQILAFPDDGGGKTQLYMYFYGSKAYNPIPFLYPGDDLFQYRIELSTCSIKTFKQVDASYLSKVYSLDKTYDYRGITDLTNLVNLFITSSSPPLVEIFWRAARVEADLINELWYTDIRAAMRNKRVGVIEFKVEFNSTTLGMIDTIQIFIRERL